MPVRRGIDTGRLAHAVSRPGIDPRSWITMGTVQDVGFDPKNGIYADVQFIPSGEIETCLVGSLYAGDGFGSMYKPKQGDLVVVAIPDGDAGQGPVIISRVWSGSERPPSEFHDSAAAEETEVTPDPTTVVEPGKTMRVVVKDGATVRFEVSGGHFEIAASGGASVNVTSTGTVVVDSPDVRLGRDASQGLARIGDVIAVTLPPLAVIVPPGVPSPVFAVGSTTPPGGPISGAGQIVSGSGSAKGGT